MLYLDHLDEFPLQILNIHHLGGWHDSSKLRVQISPQHIINLRQKKLIVGKYSKYEDIIYAIFDPQSTSSLSFRNSSSLNISIQDVDLALKASIILKKDKNGSITLLLKNDWILEFSKHFYANSSEHDALKWRNLLIQWYIDTTSKIKYFNVQSLTSYKANGLNYRELKNNTSVYFIHLDNFGFKRGFRNNLSIIVDDILGDFLTYEDHFILILNAINFDPSLIQEITDLLIENENCLIKLKKDEIIFNNNLADYLNLVGSFTANQYMSCATPTEIDRFIAESYSCITLKFQDIKNDRFKERLIAGRSSEKESYYFDSQDKTINDIVYFAKSYTDFILDKLRKTENIFDLFIEVYSVEINVECLRFWHALKRALVKVEFDYFNGRFSSFKLKDDSKEYVVKIITEYLELKSERYFRIGHKEFSIYKLRNHYSFRYLQRFFDHYENSDGFHIDLNISYLENDRFAGYTFVGRTYGVGIFPLVFPEVFSERDEPYFFYVVDSVYYTRATKDVVNFYSLS